MSAEQLIVLALLGAAFIAGWWTRGSLQAEDAPEIADDAPPTAATAGMDPPPTPVTAPPTTAAPAPLPIATNGAGALEEAREALSRAIDAWLDDGGTPSRSGEEAVDALERHADKLRAAGMTAHADAADSARDVLENYLAGRPMDAAASRRLDEAESALA